MPETITLLTRRADLAPATADRDARTVEVIWSTGAPVRRHGVTVRLDGPRYRRLMVVSGRYGRTYQDILARALDVYMTALGVEDPAEIHATAPQKKRQ